MAKFLVVSCAPFLPSVYLGVSSSAHIAALGIKKDSCSPPSRFPFFRSILFFAHPKQYHRSIRVGSSISSELPGLARGVALRRTAAHQDRGRGCPGHRRSGVGRCGGGIAGVTLISVSVCGMYEVLDLVAIPVFMVRFQQYAGVLIW